jgi:DnaJ-class molecular chaperone
MILVAASHASNAGGVLTLLVLGLFFLVGYGISVRVWPYKPCKRCQGDGRNAGSNHKRHGRCKKCKGTGRAERWGTRIMFRKR